MTTIYSADLVIMFSSEALTSSNATIYIRALIDGKGITTGRVILITKQGNWQAHGFDFYRPSLLAGRHTVQMQWRIDAASPDFARLGKRTLIVMANGAGS